ncbi:methyltransferase domain-containing protein [Catenovulum agarivorans]|nr:methyltransferase domain-containing protein [Catenovulum agarivorans]
MYKPDQSFTDIADKFADNIYKTTKGRLRLAVLQHDLAQLGLAASNDRHIESCAILDVGAGLGHMSVWLAQQGHRLTAVEVAPNLLDTAKAFAQSAGVSVDFHCMPAQDYVAQNLDKQFDWVVCHAVLEWIAQPQLFIECLFKVLKPGGKLSIMFFNNRAKLIGNLLYGNFDYISNGLKAKKQVRLNPNYPQEPQQVYTWLEAYGEIVHKRGVRSFHDYMLDRSMWQSHFEQIVENELAVSDTEPFISMGKYIHVVVEKNTD